MANSHVDVIAPKSLILPSNASGDANAVAGTIVLSGATLSFFTGSAWKTLTMDA